MNNKKKYRINKSFEIYGEYFKWIFFHLISSKSEREIILKFNSKFINHKALKKNSFTSFFVKLSYIIEIYSQIGIFSGFSLKIHVKMQIRTEEEEEEERKKIEKFK